MADTRPNKSVRTYLQEGPSLRSRCLCAHGCAGVLGGFTFIELLATVVLLGIIMPVAMQSIGLCTRLGGQSRKQIEAASLAHTKLTELIVSGDWSSGSKSGDFGTDWPGYRWTAAVTSWTDSVVSQLDVTVTWQSQGRERSMTASTLVYPEDS
jgi:prepilin-type N-terminal cleavage/methylation domain-containing protein